MSTITVNKTPATVIATGTSVAAASTQRNAIACATADGGILTVKITNGATGPTVGATVNIMVAHDVSGTPPATGAAGATWKTIASFVCDVTANLVTERAFNIPKAAGALQVEVSGHTGQAVTAEAIATLVTSYTSI